jgi:DNA-binding PucR family transcriptional regulator
MEPVQSDNAAAATLIVTRLGGRLADISELMQQHLLAEIGEYREHTALLPMLFDSVQQNVETVFSAIQHETPVEQLKAPPAALTHARELARRGSPANTLIRAYRLGHQALLDIVLDDVRNLELPDRQALDVFQLIATTTFGYIDQITHEVTTTYQLVRDQCLAAANTARALRVRELLDSGPVDIDTMSTEIGYPLRGTHVAIVFSYPDLPRGEELMQIDRFARQLAESVGSQGSPLLIVDDRLTGWGWLSFSDNDSAQIAARARAFIAGQSAPPQLAIGDALPGVEGFRRSHRQAMGARAVSQAGGRAHPMIANCDPGVAAAALHAGNLPAAREWVGEVLGPLSSATESDARLRDTLRVFLLSGSSYKAASSELTMHFNTVRYRVQRAEERLGRPISGTGRLDVELALLLCDWFGDAVLH